MSGSAIQRRIIPWVLVVLGVVMIAAGSVEIAVSLTADDVLDLVRPEMTDEGLAQHRADLETAETVMSGFSEDVLPTVADAFGVPPALVSGAIQLGYPDVARVVDDREEMAAFAEASLANLERQQENFESADDLPAPGLPTWSGGAALVVAGLIAAGCGAWMLLRPAMAWRPAVLAAAIIGVLLVAVPLALQVPWKAADAQEVLDSLNPSEEATEQTVAYMEATRAGMTELEEELIPDAAAALGMTPEELRQQVDDDFPELGAALDEMPGVLDRYEARTNIRVEAGPDLRMLKDIPIGVLSWTAPVLGVVLAGVAAWAWFARPSAAPVVTTAPATDAALEEAE